MNNDERHDFIQNTANGKVYLSFGTNDLSTPTQDEVLGGQSSTNWNWNMQYNPYSEFGDLTGDGIDDGLLSHTEQSSGTMMLGRRILAGSGSGSYSSTFYQYPRENFYSRIVGAEEIGDINGDGVDDFVMGGERQRIMVFYGGSSISQTPDMTLSLSYRPNNIIAGEFTGDGNQDLIIGGRQDQQTLFKLFEGSKLTPVKTVYASDFQTVDAPYIHGIQNIGDVNADGVNDFLTGSSTAHDSTGSGLSYLNEAYIFFGGSTIPSSPDANIPMGGSSSNYVWAGETAAALGDMNGDGVDDFTVSAAFAMNSDESRGKVFVMYGGASKSFSEPDMILRPEKFSSGFGAGLSSGDYNGDGNSDVAVSGSSFNSGETEPPTAVHVYYGGLDFDNAADRFLALPRFTLYQGQIEGDGYRFGIKGTIETIPDFTNDGKDELLFSSSRFSANHTALYTFSTEKPDPTSVLRAPNKAAGLGGMSNMATGDFDNNGEVDVVLTQVEDNNDAYRSSRVYRFGLPKPITISKVEDVPDDQGRRIRIHAGGYLMEAMNRDVYGMDSWSVWRMTKDSSWTNVKTVSPSSAGARFVDVTVNKTQPTNVDSIDNSYTFRLEAFNKNKGGVIARSDTSSGMAFDNISPPQVQSTEINEQNGERLISWQPTKANDIGKYLVYRAEDDNLGNEPVGASNTTNFTLPNSFSGVQNFAIKARDVNNNTGAASSLTSAIYPKKVKFKMKSGWNLIGLPVNASADSIQKALQSASNIYEYSGGYTQVDQLKAGIGYWAKFSQANLRQLQGRPVTKLTLDLKKGWNLISGVGGELPLTLVQDPDGIIVQNTLYSFDQAYSQSDTLRPSSGYWLQASAAGTVTFTHPKLVEDQQRSTSNKSPLAKQQHNVRKSFSTITVSDGEYSRELYFGSSLPKQLDKREFSLPPMAPGNFFDARFSKGTKLIEKAEGTIKLSRIEGTELSFEINPQNMVEQSYFLIRELADGKELAEYKVDAGKKVTLKHSETNAIFVTAVGNSPLIQNEVPDEFKLKQNYPNPFNPTTQIKYSVAEASQVTLEVFNILGKRVATLINKEQKAGKYQVTFDGANLASGVYLYRLPGRI
ncbi:MAG: FG-GAP-like repeat-containing protein [Fodinibius sp.]|nr:FG-GAP-like repeat-containing protein [Fodinibius sp.]